MPAVDSRIQAPTEPAQSGRRVAANFAPTAACLNLEEVDEDPMQRVPG